MCRSVPPLQVSPLIRAARWSLLFCGIVYGIVKLQSYRLIESQVKPLRDKHYQKKFEQIQEYKRCHALDEIKILAKEFGITELPPDWEESLKKD